MTKEEFEDWARNPGTKAFMQALANRKAGIVKEWANGSFTGSTMDETVQSNARAIGNVQQLDEIMELEYEWWREYLPTGD